MKVFEGKSPSERNKMIAAAALGVISLFALYLAFGRSLFGSSTSVKVTVSPTPRPTAAPAPDKTLPSDAEQNFVYQTTPIVYTPGASYPPDAGRNIFAFYEPPPPCLDCPTPTPKPVEVKTPPPPTPAPPPPLQLASANPQSVYAGAGSFRLDVTGGQFPPNARIYFNQAEMPTKYIDAGRLSTEIPANLIGQEGPRQVIVQTPDGKLYSNQVMMTVQAPPKPQLQYIGMIGRKRYNNDTAYLIESGQTMPVGKRLNDVVQGRFKVVDISLAEVVFEDVNLGFKHRIPLSKATGGLGVGQPGNGFVPSGQGTMIINGIPTNVPRYIPPDKKKDVDDDDGGPE